MLLSYINIGENHLHFERIDSTNVFAQQILSKTNPIEGTVITAAFQTHGKGQFDRIWQASEGKNIIMSVILYPEFIFVHQQALLNISITLAIIDYLKSFDSKFKIKWPNDLFYENKKICGILIQNQIATGRLKNSIVGIGLNVNQKEFGSDLMNKATSLSLLFNKDFKLDEEYRKLWKCIEQRYTQLVFLKANEEVIAEYNSNLLGIDTEVEIESEERKFLAKIKGVDISGRLNVIEDGESFLLNHGEVKIAYWG